MKITKNMNAFFFLVLNLRSNISNKIVGVFIGILITMRPFLGKEEAEDLVCLFHLYVHMVGLLFKSRFFGKPSVD